MKWFSNAVIIISLFAGTSFGLINQASADTFHRETNVGIWSKDRFADSVSITGSHKTIYLAGMGSEDIKDGHIRFTGDAYKQCQYAYEKIKSALAKQGANVADIVKITAYITDTRFYADYMKCKSEAMKGAPITTHTFVQVSNLAHPGMLVEVDATAVVAAE